MEVSRTAAQRQEQVQATQRVDEARQANQHQAASKAQASSDAKKSEPLPVVNGQGQTIGTRLNVSA